jgi:hypothetical protein
MSSNEGSTNARKRIPEEAVSGKIEKGVRTKKRVFSIIETSDGGKSTSDLVMETGLSRDRIHEICKEYMDEGDLYKTGRYGKYRLTPKALGDPSKKGFFFCLEMMKRLSFFEDISADNKFCNTKYIQNIRNRKGLNRNPNALEELALFEFVLIIGSITTYEMLRGIKFASDWSEVNAKDALARKWIDNVINPGLILARFADIPEVEQRLKRNNSKERPYSFYDMDSKDVGNLMQSFQKVFPEVYRRSEGILSGLQSKIDSYRKHAKETSERDNQMRIDDPKHTKCGGELIPEIKTTSDGLKVQQCAKCRRWIKVRNSK